eukprot:CAMPEP_0194399714 /NCGR_PEP_ID=MMETSP0174-20130528/126811_1 /TAXON_ID=216777 /ORGANISM="Proboscia alata, Strain PI-D3" /LENGTH=340 /DNA_ID=CAMNT_0039196149 /DNA_START=341 /DNA_END=1363 /DNA_ORIENTATION=+
MNTDNYKLSPNTTTSCPQSFDRGNRRHRYISCNKLSTKISSSQSPRLPKFSHSAKTETDGDDTTQIERIVDLNYSGVILELKEYTKQRHGQERDCPRSNESPSQKHTSGSGMSTEAHFTGTEKSFLSVDNSNKTEPALDQSIASHQGIGVTSEEVSLLTKDSESLVGVGDENSSSSNTYPNLKLHAEIQVLLEKIKYMSNSLCDAKKREVDLKSELNVLRRQDRYVRLMEKRNHERKKEQCEDHEKNRFEGNICKSYQKNRILSFSNMSKNSNDKVDAKGDAGSIAEGELNEESRERRLHDSKRQANTFEVTKNPEKDTETRIHQLECELEHSKKEFKNR